LYDFNKCQCLSFSRFAVFLVVADESVGRSVPFVFLERVKDDFKKHYGASINNDGAHPLAGDDDDDDLFEDRFSIAYNLDREFGFVYAGSFLFFSFLFFFLFTYL
jgi:hypothetical protein